MSTINSDEARKHKIKSIVFGSIALVGAISAVPIFIGLIGLPSIALLWAAASVALLFGFTVSSFYQFRQYKKGNEINVFNDDDQSTNALAQENKHVKAKTLINTNNQTKATTQADKEDQTKQIVRNLAGISKSQQEEKPVVTKPIEEVKPVEPKKEEKPVSQPVNVSLSKEDGKKNEEEEDFYTINMDL